MDNNDRICIECKWSVKTTKPFIYGGGYGSKTVIMCSHPETQIKDFSLVNGETYKLDTCSSERLWEVNKCGPEGKLWEKKSKWYNRFRIPQSI